MKKMFFAGILIATFFSSCAQTRCSINKAYAYFTVSIPGTQMVDEKGNPVPPVLQVERFIYLEGKGMNKPVVESVLYNNNMFTVALTKVESNIVSAGKKIGDEKEIFIKARNGNSLWKLELQPVADKPQDASAAKNISIRIKNAGKLCLYKVSGGEVQLSTMPRY